MTPKKEAMIWGAVAGAATVLAEMLTLDPASLFSDFNWATFFGYCVKIVGLMILGAVVVRVNNETNTQKAFQLGIMAPALIVGIQSGANLNSTEAKLYDVRSQLQQIQQQGSTEGANVSPSINRRMFQIVSSAYAQEVIPKGEHREVSFLTRFWYGLTGNEAEGWFVIAGSHKQRSDAEKQAARLANQGWSVKIGESYAWGGYYSVLIGSYLSKEKAIAIRDYAIKQGLPKDTYVWRK
jgi:hypothetical protein